MDIVRPLTNRLQITKWRKENPDVATNPVSRPIFIVGQPRTGHDHPVRPARPGPRRFGRR